MPEITCPECGNEFEHMTQPFEINMITCNVCLAEFTIEAIYLRDEEIEEYDGEHKERSKPFYKTGHYVCKKCGEKIDDAEADTNVSYSTSKNFRDEINEHVKMHRKEDALDFIRDEQPIGGKIISSKFKGISLRELEKQGKIKFSEKDSGWVLESYSHLSSVSKVTTDELKFASIQGAPCIDCKLVEDCWEDGDISPKTCQWIKDWVDPEFIGKKIINDQNDDTLPLNVAKFFLHYGTSFNVKGKITKEENLTFITDESGHNAYLNMKGDELHLISNGDEVKLSNVSFMEEHDKTLRSRARMGLRMDSRYDKTLLNCRNCKIQKLNPKL